MGSRFTRAFRNFNLENRVVREMNKPKPSAAPRYPSDKHQVEQSSEESIIHDDIHKKNDHLLKLLKTIYVDSKDPTLEKRKPDLPVLMEVEHRHPKFSLPNDSLQMLNIKTIPKGKLTVVEAVMILNNHKKSPATWTVENIAQEYCLDLNETKAFLDFFIPFNVKIIPPKQDSKKKIKAT
ncbi:NDUF4 factor, partial [Polypterus senegalus]